MNNQLTEVMTMMRAQVKENLRQCCIEMAEWRDTGVLRDGKVREIAYRLRALGAHSNYLPVVADEIKNQALNEMIDDIASNQGEYHPDDRAIDAFALAMKQKMAACRAKGRGGWDDPSQCTVEKLVLMLDAQFAEDGDLVDIGNLAMMLFNRGCKVVPEPVSPEEFFIPFSD